MARALLFGEYTSFKIFPTSSATEGLRGQEKLLSTGPRVQVMKPAAHVAQHLMRLSTAKSCRTRSRAFQGVSMYRVISHGVHILLI